MTHIPSYVSHTDEAIKGFFGPFRFLSNFPEYPTAVNGIIFPSSECAYQAQKVAAPHREEFRFISSSEAKRKWKEIGTIYTEEQWNAIRYEVMVTCVFDKFYRNPDARQLLLDTGNKYLAELNNWGDTYFGIDVNHGGKNKLGQLLMRLRAFWQPTSDKILHPFL
jgi:ribA/ribD-fused uncharacterized protein